MSAFFVARLSSCAAVAALLLPIFATAQTQTLPEPGSVVHGAITFSTPNPHQLLATQSTGLGIVEWTDFSIGNGYAVHFDNGPGATLNRVTGSLPSAIDGLLTATGSVYLINPAGVVVGTQGRVEAGGTVVLSTLDVGNADFLDGGGLTFAGTSVASVINLGRIGSLGGDVALIARAVRNEGAITAPAGTAALAAGYEVLLNDATVADGKFFVSVGGSDTEVRNTGTIEAAQAELRAQGGNVYALAGNTGGTISATGVSNEGGRLFLTAPGGTVQVEGTLSASQPAANAAPASLGEQGATAGASSAADVPAADAALAAAAVTGPTPAGSAAVNSGAITIAADSVALGGTLDVSGAGGGTVRVESTGDVLLSGTIDAQGTQAAGGQVAISGRDVRMLSGAMIDVGGTSGGTILIGGDRPGAAIPAPVGFALPAAANVSIASGSVLRADGTAGDGGLVSLWADQATQFDGAIFARGGETAGNGGFVEVSGNWLGYAGSVDLRAPTGVTGTLLLDPWDIVIHSGADANHIGFVPIGFSTINATTLTNALATANVVVSTAGAGGDPGNITIIAPLAWSSASVLTLLANNNIAIHSAITAPNGGLTLIAQNQVTATAAVHVGDFTLAAGAWIQNAGGGTLPGFSANDFRVTGSASFLRVLDGTGSAGSPYQLTDVYGLQGVGTSAAFRAASWALANDIDAAVTASWWDGAGFVPVGTTGSGNGFRGVFDGQGFVISDLTIDRPTMDDVGLFGRVEGVGVAIRDVGLEGGSVRGGVNRVGALVGNMVVGSIQRSYATGAVTGSGNVGGLVGGSGGSITQSYATGAVTGSGNVGGLVGTQNGGSITQSYATGSVSGNIVVGGLVGLQPVGSGSITQSYATGLVTGNINVGGLVGDMIGNIAQSYWDVDTTGLARGVGTGAADPAGVAGLGSASVFGHSSFESLSYAGWSIGTTTGITVPATDWLMIEGETRPFGAWEHSTEIVNLHQLQLMVFDLNATYTLRRDIDASPTTGANASDMWTARGFVPVGHTDVANSFTGTLDGQDHVISGLTIDRPGTNDVGLFGRTQNATITDVGLVGGSVHGNSLVGALVGNQRSGSITQSYATGTVTGNAGVGGLVGTTNSGGSITQSYATGAVTGSGSIGGLVGQLNGGGSITQSYAMGAVAGGVQVGGLVGGTVTATITQSYATGAVTAGSKVGGLVGLSAGGDSITQSYATGAVTGNNDVGGLVGGTTMVNSVLIAQSYWDVDTTGLARGVGSSSLAEPEPAGVAGLGSGSVSGNSAFQSLGYAGWNIGTAMGNDVPNTDWLMIEGETRPFGAWEQSTEIRNLHQLQLMVFDLDADYNLVRDIDASPTTGANPSDMWTARGFVPLGDNNNSFSGTFDGQEFVISGLAIDRTSTDFVGLFYWTQNATIGRVGLEGGSIRGNSQVGSLVGLQSGGSITQSYATAEVSGSNAIGGLVGENGGGTIAQSYATGAVSGSEFVGGLVGESASGNIAQSYATGAVTGSSNVGGLVGNNSATITQSYATGAVTGSSNVGGLVGNSSATITQSYWDVNTTGRTDGRGTGSGTFDATGLSTVALQGALQADFDAAVWGIVPDISYPYHQWRFPDGPSVISGTVSGVPSGNGRLGVQVAAAGEIVGATHTGANGYYYLAVDRFAGASSTPILSFLDGTQHASADITERGNALAMTAGGHATGLDIDSGWVRVASNALLPSLSQVQTQLLDAAKGDLDDDAILYDFNSGFALTAGIGLRVDAAAPAFAVDVPLATTGAIWILGPGDVTLGAGVSIETSGPGTGSGPDAGSITLQAGRNIIGNTGASVSTQGQDIVLNADRNATGGGNIQLTNSTINSNGGAIVLGGGADPLTTAAIGSGTGSTVEAAGIFLSGSTLTAGAGAISLRGQGIAGASGTGGIHVENVSAIGGVGATGNITLHGTGGAGTSGNYGVLLIDSGTAIRSADGAISITGVGGGGSNSYGVVLYGGAVVESTGTGANAATVTLHGTGGAGADASTGVYLATVNTAVRSAYGNIVITGEGGAGNGLSNYGVHLNRAVVESTGTGENAATVMLHGTGGASSTNNHGVVLDGSSAAVRSADGDIAIVGQGGAGISNGVYLYEGGAVKSTGTADITLTATGSGAVADFVTSIGASTLGGFTAAGDITINANTINWGASLLTVQSTGHLTIQPRTPTASIGIGTGAAGTLLLNNNALNGIQDGFSSITIGHAAGSGAIAVRSYAFKDNLIIRTPTGNGDITLNGALATGSGLEAGSITLQAGRNIIATSGTFVTTQGQDIVLNSDRDATGGGNIQLFGTNIISNGGAIVLGGGADPLNTAAIGSVTGTTNQVSGIALSNSALRAGTGDISLHGKGMAETTFGAPGIFANNSAIGGTDATGNIALHGTGGAGTDDNVGVYLSSSFVQSEDGAIVITGVGGGSGSDNHGIFLTGAAVVESTGTATVTLTATAAGAAADFAATGGIASTLGGSTAAGAITINADTISWGSSLTLQSTGTLTIQPRTPTVSIGIGNGAAGTLFLNNNALNGIQDGFAEIVIGRADGTGTITTGSYTFVDPLRLRTGGSLNVNGALGTGANRLVLLVGDTASQSGAITAGSLHLGGNGDFNLTHADNSIGTLAKDGAGSVDLHHSGALIVGTVDGVNGVTGSTVDLRTNAGNLTLNQAVTGTAAGNAVVLSTPAAFINNAGASGVQATDASGRWLIYSASPAGNTFGGLDSANTALWNASVATLVPEAVAALGNRYLFSLQMTLTFTSVNDEKTYGDTADLSGAYTVAGYSLGIAGAFLADDASAAFAGTPLVDSDGAPALANVDTYAITIGLGTLESAAGYGFDFVNDGVLTVNPRTLVFSAEDKTRLYGDTNPALTFGATIGGDGLAAHHATLAAAGFGLTTDAVSTSDVGEYDIALTGANGNYNIVTFSPGTLTVEQRTLLFGATDQSRLYGDANPTLTFAAAVGGDGLAAHHATLAAAGFGLTTGAAPTSDVGNYDITLTGTNANYIVLGFTEGTLAVTPRTLVFSAEDKTRLYGDANPALTFAPAIGGDGLAVHHANLVAAGYGLQTDAAPTSDVGEYGITLTGANGNYNIVTFTPGTLTVEQRTLLFGAADQSRLYGDTNLPLTFDPTIGGDGLAAHHATLAAASFGLTTDAAPTSNVGNYDITLTGVNGNYAITFAPGMLMVDQRTLIFGAADQSRLYGDANPALTFDPTIGGDGLATHHATLAVAGFGLTTDAAPTSDVGNYDITLTGTNSNYIVLDFTEGTLAVTPRSLVFSAEDKTQLYGDANPALTFATTIDGDGLAAHHANLAAAGYGLQTDAAPTSDVGTYDITLTGTNGNYNVVAFTPGVLTVEQRTLMFSAADQSRLYGDANPALTFDPTIGGDGLATHHASLAAAGFGLTTGAEATSNVGDYDITLTGANGNYNIVTFTPGVLTVEQRTLVFSAADQSRLYGDTNPALTFDPAIGGDGLAAHHATLFDAGYGLETDAVLVSNVGNYDIALTGVNGNYAITFAPGTLTVNPRTLVFSAENRSRLYGDANPALTFAATIDGDGLAAHHATLADAGFGLTTDAVATSNVGNYDITLTGANGNYTVLGFTEGTLTVNPRTLVFSAEDKTRLYGNANPALTFATTIGGDGLAAHHANLAAAGYGLQTDAAPTSDVGEYDITLTGVSGNYNIVTFTPGVLTVEQRTLMFGAADLSRLYGDANPALTFDPTIGGDGLATHHASLAAAGFGLTTGAEATSNVGDYDITLTGANGNYNIVTFPPGVLTVEQRTLVFSAADQSRLYGDTNPALTFDPAIGGDGLAAHHATLAAAGFGLTTDAAPTSDVGNYDITLIGTNGNYNIVAFTPGVLTVNQRSLVFSAADQSRLYGDANPALTFATTIDGDGLAAHHANLAAAGYGLQTDAAPISDVGLYDITLTGVNGNYAITFAPGTLTVEQRTLVFGGADQLRLYGDTNPPLTFDPAIGGDGLAAHHANLAAAGYGLQTDAAPISDVGLYDITLTGGNGNYNIVTFTPGVLTVEQRTLVFGAADQSRLYGDANPLLTFDPTIGGDGLAAHHTSLAEAGFGLTTGAVATSDVGTYDITLTGTNGNYTVLDFTEGTLAVIPRTLVFSAEDKTRLYGNANPALTFGATIDGDGLAAHHASLADAGFGLDTDAVLASNVGVYDIALTGTNGNYAIDFTPGTLAVNPRALAVTADGQSKVYGAPDPVLSFVADGFQLADDESVLTGALAREPGEAVGWYAILRGTLAASNYDIVYSGNVLDIFAPIGAAPLEVGPKVLSPFFGVIASPAGGSLFWEALVFCEPDLLIDSCQAHIPTGL